MPPRKGGQAERSIIEVNEMLFAWQTEGVRANADDAEMEAA